MRRPTVRTPPRVATLAGAPTRNTEWSTWLTTSGTTTRTAGAGAPQTATALRLLQSAMGGVVEPLQGVLDLSVFSVAFHARRRVLGPRGGVVHHLQDLSGARVWCKPDQLVISADSQDDLDMATQMAKDLVATVTGDFSRLRERG